MSMLYLIGGALAVFILVYLLIVLFQPERFS